MLHSEPFADQAPAEVYAALLDQGRYVCSIRTMYRILDEQQEVRERRNQLRYPKRLVLGQQFPVRLKARKNGGVLQGAFVESCGQPTFVVGS